MAAARSRTRPVSAKGPPARCISPTCAIPTATSCARSPACRPEPQPVGHIRWPTGPLTHPTPARITQAIRVTLSTRSPPEVGTPPLREGSRSGALAVGGSPTNKLVGSPRSDAVFEALSDKLTGVFDRLRGRGALSEPDVTEALREVRLALLDADVALPVVRDFIAKVRERAVGAEVLASVTPGQQV